MVLDRLVTALGNLFEINGKQSASLNALLVVAAIIAVASVGYAVTVSDTDHRYTEFYLLSENQSGELVAENYTNSIEAERPTTFHVGIENHLGGETQYAVVVKLQRIYLGNETPEVLEEQVLRSSRVTVPENGRQIRSVNVTPEIRGAGMRLVFLLYRDAPPEQPSMENAYHETHLWVNVTAPSSTENSTGSLDPSFN